MPSTHLIPEDIADTYEVREWCNATAVLAGAQPGPWADIIEALRAFHFTKADVLTAGGAHSGIAQHLFAPLSTAGWSERSFELPTYDHLGRISSSHSTHLIDGVKDRTVLEIEWNNKDTFFDRDIAAFRRIFERQWIDAAVIITRAESLQELFNRLGKGAAYGASTTHMSKLEQRMADSAHGGCPILAFGITEHRYQDVDAHTPTEQDTLFGN